MDVVSQGAVSAALVRWLLPNGQPAVTVVCKSTFVLRQGELVPAPQQPAPFADEAYWETADPRAALGLLSDMAPYKAKADVVLTGHVHAPRGAPARSLLARLSVGAIDKAIEVWSDRSFAQSGELREGPLWTRQRLTYERAAGGPDTSNPAGLRPDALDGMGATAVPVFQPPGTHVSRRGETLAPIGFGPLPPSFPGRVFKLYRHAHTFLRGGWSTRPMPQDIDPAFFNFAPPDQQLDELRGDELVVLEHLSPDSPRLSVRLPGLTPKVQIARAGQLAAGIALSCDTLWIDTDAVTFALVWRATVPLAHANEAGQIKAWLDAPAAAAIEDENTVAPEQEAPREPRLSGRVREHTLVPFGGVAGKPLPFQQPAAGPPAGTGGSPPSAAPAGARLPPTFGAPPGFGASGFSGAPGAPPTFSAPPPAAPPGFSGPAGAPPGFGAASSGQPVFNAPAPAPSPAAVAGPPPSGMVPPAAVVAPPAAVVAPPAAVVAPPAPFAARDSLPGAGLPQPAWASGSLGEARKPAGSIGERLATEAAMAESRAQAERRPGSELESLGYAAPAAPAEAPWPAEEPPKRGAAPAKGEAREAVLLLWHDPASVPRLRRKPDFRDIFDALEEGEPDMDLEASLTGEVAENEDERFVFEVLARGEPAEGDAVNRALSASIRPDGKFVPAILLLAGELVFPFDELEALRATVTTITPIAGGDETLKGNLATAGALLATPNVACAPAVAEGMTQRIRESFAQAKRVVPAGYVEAQTDRTLLEQRHYQRRKVFGKKQVRALLQLGGSPAPVPCYLPEEAAEQLPLMQRFRARVIAAAHFAEDQNETHPAALKVLALARLVASPAAQQGQGGARK